jgi:RNA-directed DNA polymerase
MRDSLQEFPLSLHPEKTRLIEFGRFAAQNRERHGHGKPDTFKFLGFVLICGKTRRGAFQIQRKSRSDRGRAKLRGIGEELRRRSHKPIPETGGWLAQVVAGYFAYHARPHKPKNRKPPKKATAKHRTLHANHRNGVKLPDVLY